MGKPPTRTPKVKFHYSSFIIHYSLKAKLPRIIPREFVLCWHLLIFPGRYQPSIVSASELNFRVRDGNGCTLTAIDTNYLKVYTLKTEQRKNLLYDLQNSTSPSRSYGASSPVSSKTAILTCLNRWSSPRPISTAKLNMSPYLHTQPINHIVFVGSYLINSVGYLILRLASRLDAFSVYPIRT